MSPPGAGFRITGDTDGLGVQHCRVSGIKRSPSCSCLSLESALGSELILVSICTGGPVIFLVTVKSLVESLPAFRINGEETLLLFILPFLTASGSRTHKRGLVVGTSRIPNTTSNSDPTFSTSSAFLPTPRTPKLLAPPGGSVWQFWSHDPPCSHTLILLPPPPVAVILHSLLHILSGQEFHLTSQCCRSWIKRKATRHGLRWVPCGQGLVPALPRASAMPLDACLSGLLSSHSILHSFIPAFSVYREPSMEQTLGIHPRAKQSCLPPGPTWPKRVQRA